MSKDLTPDRKYSAKEFWAARPLLAYIKKVASKTRKSEYAILGWLMVWVLARIPYKTVYKSDVGSASLNMLFLMSGPTGTGKSAARKAAKENFAFADVGWSCPAPMQAGSGEAIADSFFVKTRTMDDEGNVVWIDEWVNSNHCRIFFNDEISFHKGKAHQNSSTLEATYLSMYSGDTLGRSLAGGKGKEVPADEYRAMAIFNAQPENDPFRSDAAKASGMPSRLLNLSAVNPNVRADYAAAEAFELPSEPEEGYQIPKLGGLGDNFTREYRALPEMDHAHAEEDFLASEGLRDYGESHTLLTRAKAACVLAALEGRTYLQLEDWHLAGHLIDHSRSVNRHIEKVIKEAQRSEAGKSGAILGVKMDAADSSKELAAIERVSNSIRRHAPDAGYDLSKPKSAAENVAAAKTLAAKFSSRDREYIDPALTLIMNEVTKGGDI
jgi:hypothetical protein